MKARTIQRRLENSARDRRIVTVVRDAFETAMTDGFVVAIADDWIVVHSLDDGVYLDRLVMLRRMDISRVSFRDDDAYHHRAIVGVGGPIAEFACEDDVAVAALLALAAEGSRIFSLHMEVLVDEPLAVGRLLKLRKKSLELHYVGRDGVWARQTERWRYRDVTRIEVGGRYLDALNRYADPYPSSSRSGG